MIKGARREEAEHQPKKGTPEPECRRCSPRNERKYRVTERPCLGVRAAIAHRYPRSRPRFAPGSRDAAPDMQERWHCTVSKEKMGSSIHPTHPMSVKATPL
jgi:hypothetical protein